MQVIAREIPVFVDNFGYLLIKKVFFYSFLVSSTIIRL